MDLDMIDGSGNAAALGRSKEAIRKIFDPSGVSWIKSAQSMGNGNCVELAQLPAKHVAVRDSWDKSGPVLFFTPSEWKAFVDGIKDGQFDVLQ